MGLLDDAIREHLELKRRRGADPDEVARQEGEALGDPRTGEFTQPTSSASTGTEPASSASTGTEPASSAGTGAQPTAAESTGAKPAGDDAPLPGEELDAEPPAPAAAEPEPEDEPWLEDEPLGPSDGQSTAAFAPAGVDPEPEVVRPDDEPGPDEDVLEETPEFLQETPEHDRLWFEQKPPRDFDFDS